MLASRPSLPLPRLPALTLAALGLAVAWSSCFRLNLSASLPTGLYFLIPNILSRPLERGDLVLVCPPPNITATAHTRGYAGFGLCPGFVPEILKPIGALPGDAVAVRDGFVWVNHSRVPSALVLPRDSRNRPLAPFSLDELEVPAGSVFLLSTHSPRSWDSRYFGPVPLARVRARAVPLWRFGR
ncbi:MAG: conjugative transfer signal peptidase TraF [Thermoanaerobaculia bacterium]|nr:conjugative transfer signal peptidase TraF [Thermoanaerobaculia bacterium]